MARRTANADKKSPPGRLRIVAGNWRSRLLRIADVPGLRPTPERVRETLFNWLAPRLAGAKCLDLFAGTGALGLEALSRGAAAALFIEESAPAARTLRRHVKELGAADAEVRQMDAFDFLHHPDRGDFDIVFLDPPFAPGIIGDLCAALGEANIMAADARVYIEEDRNRPPAELPDGWRVLKTKTAGNVRYSLVSPASSA